MKSLIALGFATLYGLFFRLFFGFLSDYLEIMGITFLGLLPFIIGFLTIVLQPKDKEITGTGAFFLPWLTSLIILFITIVFSVEGAICWVMIYPFFAVLAGIGGLIARAFRKNAEKKQSNLEDDPTILDQNDWNKPTTLNVSVLLLLPLVSGLIEGNRTTSKQDMLITKEIIINASPEKVWYALAHIDQVKHAETPTYFTNMMGFPHHLTTTLDTLAVGGTRIATYEKGLFFVETITKHEPQRLLVLAIDVDPTKIPPTVLDEHIVIGGKHVDVLEDIYRLEPLADGRSHLTLSSRFYINTPFNWYAGIWANYLMSDILHGELALIQARASR